MKCSILEVSLLLAVLNPDTAEDGDHEDIPEVIFSNGSSLVLLPCSMQSHTQIKEIQWIFYPASGNNSRRICSIKDSAPQCSSPRFPHITLAETDGFRTGNYSLLFTATMEDAGIYICFLHTEHPNKRMTIRLIVINVSVTPASPIPLGTSVNLTCEMSDTSYFNRIDWGIENTQVTAKGNKIQWKVNNAFIHKDKRHKLDLRSLNINNFQLHDAGRYTYTVRLKNGKTCSYHRLLEISGTAPTSLATHNPPTATSDPTKASKRIPIITGATVGLAVLVLATILIVVLIKKKHKSAKEKEESEGPYINVPPQRKKTEQDETDLNSTYMGLKLEEQSVYSQLQR